MLYTDKMLEIIGNEVELANYRGEYEKLKIADGNVIKDPVINEKFNKHLSITDDIELEISKSKELFLILDSHDGRSIKNDGELFIDASQSKRVRTVLKRNFKTVSKLNNKWSVDILKITDTNNRKPILLKMKMTNGIEKIVIIRGHYVNIVQINHLDNYLKKFNITDVDIKNITFTQI